MSKIELYIVYVIAALFVYGVVVTRAYTNQRKSLRYYKRHYDAQPKSYRRRHKPTVCERVVDFLMILSPVK